MTRKEHIKRHQELHQMLDELIADFITHTDKLPFETSLIELVEWSYKQTQNPSEDTPKEDRVIV